MVSKSEHVRNDCSDKMLKGGALLRGNSLMAPTMLAKNNVAFDPKKFLATIGEGRKVVAHAKKQTIFTQDDAADTVFYIQEGKVRLTVVSKTGKEATLGILRRESFSEKVGWPDSLYAWGLQLQ